MAGYSKMDALQALVGGQITVYSDGTDPIYHDGQTPPSEEEIDAKIAELKAKYDAEEYARQRKSEYPSIEECVHAILDDDLTALQEKRQAVKTKYPKPTD